MPLINVFFYMLINANKNSLEFVKIHFLVCNFKISTTYFERNITAIGVHCFLFTNL